MNIGFSTLGCDSGRSGIGRYAINLLEEFCKVSEEDAIEVFGHDADRESFLKPKLHVRWRTVSNYWQGPLLSILWHQVKLPALSKDLDVLFLPAGNRRLPFMASVPRVGTVHDLSSFHVEAKYNLARDMYIKKVLPRLIRKLDHVVTVSESTKCDIVRYCEIEEDSISVIPLAADSMTFYPDDPDRARALLSADYGLTQPFLLYVSRIEHPGKNHIRLIHAFDQLKAHEHIPHQLVFVGPDRERSEEVHAAAEQSPHSRDIHFFGFVPNRDLRLFYTAAGLFVFPSLFEGFGLPMLEAMACGTPIACSNVSSLPEVAGNAAKLFDPLSEQDMATVIASLLAEPAERDRLTGLGLQRARSFTWKRTAQETLNVLHRVARKRPGALLPFRDSAPGAARVIR